MTNDDDNAYGPEFQRLNAEGKAAVRRLVQKVKVTDMAESEPFEGGDVYAYPRKPNIAWGVNNPLNVARGIWRRPANA